VVDQATASAAASRSCAGVLSGGVRRICPGHILLSHGAEPLEITRPPYLRKGLRYASDVTNRSAYWNRLLASIALITYCTAFYSESHQGKQAGHAGHAYTRDGQTVRFGAHRVAALGCASWLVSPAAPRHLIPILNLTVIPILNLTGNAKRHQLGWTRVRKIYRSRPLQYRFTIRASFSLT
jgi:hypothetical protein